MAFRWLITDIDGTLVDGRGEMPARNRAALQHCRDHGIPVVMATGRRWSTLLRLLDRLALRAAADFAIVNNGMVVLDLRSGSTVVQESFPAETRHLAMAALAELDWDPIVLSHNPAEPVDVHHRRLSLMNGDFIAKNSASSRAWRDEDELREVPVVELILLGPEAELRRAQAALAPLPVETALIRNTFYAGFMLEITPQGISKLSGARHLGQSLGLDLDLAQAVAVGDSANDLPLFREVGRSIAVADAAEAVLQAAQEIVGAAADAGVAAAVFRHFPATVTLK